MEAVVENLHNFSSDTDEPVQVSKPKLQVAWERGSKSPSMKRRSQKVKSQMIALVDLLFFPLKANPRIFPFPYQA
jgi:hypothetical protein